MTAVLVTTAPANTQEWHEARANGIGASEIAAVVGLSPFSSAYALWLEKKGLIPGADPDNPLFYWGHALEPIVADRFAFQHPEFWVMECGTFIAEERGWQLANPDRLLFPLEVIPNVTEPLGVLEIKSSRFGDGYGPTGSDQIPLHVRCQVQHQMDVVEVPFAHVAVLIGGSDYREYRIAADPEDQVALRDAGAAFWASLATNDEPPVDASFATYEAARKRYDDIDPDAEPFEIPNGIWDTYCATRDSIANRENTLRQLKSGLLDGMGTARIATNDGTPVLRRQMSSAGTPYLKEIQ